MAARNGPTGFCWQLHDCNGDLAVYSLDPMCGKMRGHSDMPHPHRIAVKLGRITRMPVLRRRDRAVSCNPVHQQWREEAAA